MTQMQKTAKTQKLQKTKTSDFEQICKIKEMEIFAFCVLTFEPIEVQTCSVPQNDHLNFSFVKHIHVVG